MICLALSFVPSFSSHWASFPVRKGVQQVKRIIQALCKAARKIGTVDHSPHEEKRYGCWELHSLVQPSSFLSPNPQGHMDMDNYVDMNMDSMWI